MNSNSPEFTSELQFRTYVAETLGELKSDMKSLIGNGKPGKVAEIEARLNKHDKLIYMTSGACLVLGLLGRVVLGLFGIHI